MTRYAVQQHGAQHAASSKRKHLNTLLLDQSKEIDKIYGLSPSMHYTAGLPATFRATNESITVDMQPASTTAASAGAHDYLAAETAARSVARGTAPCSAGTITNSTTASWVQPWQTGDRETGQAMAKAIRAKRVYGGGFASFDLAKAPK